MSAVQPLQFNFDATPATSFGRLCKVELRKALDTRSGRWLIYVGVILAIIADVIALLVFAINEVEADWMTFMGISGFILSILLPIIGIMLVTSEWSQRTAMVTFALEPSRLRVLMAKLVAGLLLTLVLIVFSMVLGAVFTALHAGLVDAPTSWDTEMQGVVGFFVVQELSMIAGFAIATLLLSTPLAVVVFLLYTFVLPTILFTVSAISDWFADIAPYVNFTQAQEPLFDLSVSGEQWGHLIVSTLLWVVLPFALGLWRVLRAEVK